MKGRAGVEERRIGTLQVPSEVQKERSDRQTRRRRDKGSLHQPRTEKLLASVMPETWWDMDPTPLLDLRVSDLASETLLGDLGFGL